MGVRKRQQKEVLIVQSAITLFSSKGYQATTMDDVAKQARISKGLTYFYFKNKEDLYMATTRHAFEQLNAVFQAEVEDDKKGLETILNLARAFFKFTEENKMYYEAILNFMSLLARYNDETLRQKIDPLILESPNFIHLLDAHQEPCKTGSQIIAQGIRDRSIRAELQPDTAFFTVWSMLIGYDRLKGAIHYKNEEMSLDDTGWKRGFLKSLLEMLKGYLARKTAGVQGSLF